jgi:hypothetical protein
VISSRVAQLVINHMMHTRQRQTGLAVRKKQTATAGRTKSRLTQIVPSGQGKVVRNLQANISPH